MAKKISIVIPSLGRKEELLNTINDLSQQSLPKECWEIILVMQGDFNIETIVEQCPKWNINLSVFHSPEPNASLARNIGLVESKSEIVLFLDDDLIIKNTHFLDAHLNTYSDKSISGVYGQVLDPDVPPRNSRHRWSNKKGVGWLFFPSNYDTKCYVENAASANLSVNKDFAINVGGMDIKYEKAAHREESDFCLRLTRKHGLLLFEPQASVIHLGAAQGGCRSWGKNEGVHPKHHVFGEWYFILKGLKIGTVKWYQLHFHLGVLFFRQIWNIHNKRNINALFKATCRCFTGFCKALISTVQYDKNKNTLIPNGYNYKLIYSYEI